MRKQYALLMTLLLSSLSACQTPAQRLAGWIEDSRAAGRSLLIIELRTNPSFSQVPGKAGITLVNTGTRTITGLKLTMRSYRTARVLQGPGGKPVDVIYDLAGAIPPEGMAASQGMTADWNIAGDGTDCLRVIRIEIGFQDKTVATLTDDAVDQFLTPDIDRHCAAAHKQFVPPMTDSSMGRMD